MPKLSLRERIATYEARDRYEQWRINRLLLLEDEQLAIMEALVLAKPFVPLIDLTIDSAFEGVTYDMARLFKRIVGAPDARGFLPRSAAGKWLERRCDEIEAGERYAIATSTLDTSAATVRRRMLDDGVPEHMVERMLRAG